MTLVVEVRFLAVVVLGEVAVVHCQMAVRCCLAAVDLLLVHLGVCC